MRARKIAKWTIYVALALASIVTVFEFSSPIFRPIPRQFKRVTLVSSDPENTSDFWLSWIEVQDHSGKMSYLSVRTSDLEGMHPGESMLIMTGDWDLKRSYEQKVTFKRLIVAYHPYILLLAPVYLLFAIVLWLRRRLRA